MTQFIILISHFALWCSKRMQKEKGVQWNNGQILSFKEKQLPEEVDSPTCCSVLFSSKLSSKNSRASSMIPRCLYKLLWITSL